MVFEATEGNAIPQPTARSGPKSIPSSNPPYGCSISRLSAQIRPMGGRYKSDRGPPGGEGGTWSSFPFLQGSIISVLYSATCFSCLESQDELPLVNTD